VNTKQHNNYKSSHNEVIIVGAGWSGLACGVTLAAQDIKVHLLESAPQAGGRARAVQLKNFLKGQSIDNGQHIMLGAYHAILNLFKTMGLNEADLVTRQPLALTLLSPNNSSVVLKTPSLPAPLHLVFALLSAQGLTFRERSSAIIMSLKLALKGYKLAQDISVKDLLQQHKQSSKTIQSLWQPLCLATMNTPIEKASAQVFLNVLKDSFNYKRSDSDCLFLTRDLSQAFTLPAIKFIIEHGGQIHCKQKIIQFDSLNQQFTIHSNDLSYQSQTLVLATPPHITKKLISRHGNAVLKPPTASLDYYYEPICTIYLQYPPETQTKTIMTGFFNTTSQWAIDRSVCQQAGLIAVVISGSGNHTKISHKQLAEKVHHELSSCLPDLPQWLDYRVIIEKRATFSCRVNIEQQRPYNNTQIPNLFLAGDYTNTHYPATLEGAVRSGINAAQQIILSHAQ